MFDLEYSAHSSDSEIPQSRRLVDMDEPEPKRELPTFKSMLTDALYAELLAHARGLTDDLQRAADVVQDALVRAMRAWERFIPEVVNEGGDVDLELSVRAWLFRNVKHMFVDHYRRRRSFHKFINEEWSLAEHWPTSGKCQTEAEMMDAGDEVMEAVARLPPQHRVVIEMRYFEDRDVDAMAEALGIARQTVNTRLSRAREALRKRLSEYATEQWGF